MKTLKLRINKKNLIKEIEALKKSLDIKTDSKLIKHLIATARPKEEEINQLMWENNDLRLALQSEQQDRKDFSQALGN
ncbi:MAG: hypothetical protein KZQ70_05770 [gamma proteobacterium symbiont of Lucinoma myriamae]|nr:hypothetical protein [gamma proteobacterium symbiont of Lucinoma myriamae]MCU7832024.1 hypothetical protein [gamma proteobacterium symbiont of Lucinoma myriamae]